MHRKQPGRVVPPRDQLIAPRMLPLGPEDMLAIGAILQYIEGQAQSGYAQYGRGFLLIARQEDTIEPLLYYVHPADPIWEGFTAEADLMEAVQTYDPVAKFVVFEALADDRHQVFTDIQISVWGYRFLPPTTMSA